MAVMYSPETNFGSQRSFCSGGGEVAEVAGEDVVLDAEPDPDGSGRPVLLVEDRVEPEVLDVGAAVLFRHLPADQAERAGLEPDLAVDLAALLPLVGVRHTLLLEERAGGLAEGVVLGVEDGATHGILAPD